MKHRQLKKKNYLLQNPSFVIFLGERILKAAGAAGVAAVAGVGAVAAAPFVLTAAGFTSAGKNTLFSFISFFAKSYM